jgi:hypothetical protein
MVSIDRPLIKYSTFPPILTLFLKNPGPLNSQKRFKRLNNYSCVLTGSCGNRRQKFDTVVYFFVIDSRCSPTILPVMKKFIHVCVVLVSNF